MKKWSAKFYLSLMSASLLTLFTAEVEANFWDPRCWNLCELPFEAEVQLISWKPCVDDLDYAAEVNAKDSTTTVNYKEICPEWQNGFRIVLGAPQLCRGWDLAASYAYLHGNTSKHASFDGTVSSTVGMTSPMIHPDLLPETLFTTVRGRYEFTYQEWDLLVKYHLCCSDRQELSPFFGLAGIFLSQDLKAKFDQVGTVHWDSDYWGVGLRAGSTYSYRLEDCLNFFATAQGTILAGKVDSDNNQRFTSHFKLKDDDCCHTVAGYRIAAGVNYDGCLCNYSYTLTVGYEFLNWYNISNHRVFSAADGEISEISHSTSSSTRTLGFHGVFAGIALPF